MTPERLAEIEAMGSRKVTFRVWEELLAAALEGIDAREDAERYRWIRRRYPSTFLFAVFDKSASGKPEEVDAAVDAARAK